MSTHNKWMISCENEHLEEHFQFRLFKEQKNRQDRIRFDSDQDHKFKNQFFDIRHPEMGILAIETEEDLNPALRCKASPAKFGRMPNCRYYQSTMPFEDGEMHYVSIFEVYVRVDNKVKLVVHVLNSDPTQSEADVHAPLHGGVAHGNPD